MINSITRSLNIVVILTKSKDRKQIFCQQNYMFGLQVAIFKVNTVNTVNCQSKFFYCIYFENGFLHV